MTRKQSLSSLLTWVCCSLLLPLVQCENPAGALDLLHPTKQLHDDSFLAGVSNHATHPQPHRQLQGDWNAMNELLRSTVLSLPDTDIQEMLLFQLLTISLRDMECSQISFEDIQLFPDLGSQEEAGLDFNIVNLGLQCEFDFDWSYIFLVGNGHAVVRIGESSAAAGLNFASQNFTQYPPENATVTQCTTDINILGIEFSGNIASQIFNLFEQLIVDVVNDLLNSEICGELKDIGAELLGDVLSMAYEYILPYLEPVDEWRYNVTYPEDSMVVPDNVTLVSWTDDSGYGQFMDAALTQMESLLGSLQQDENAPSGTLTFPNGTEYPDGYDLGINVMLRAYLLDEDRALTVDRDVMAGFNTSTVLVSTHDKLTETNISLVSLSVSGLDTFTVMEPFQRYQDFTLQNELHWEYLSVEAVIKLEVKASSLEDSYIRDAERVEPYVEEIKITVGVEDLHTIISVMLALDPDSMRELRVGSLIDLTSMLPCVLSALHVVTLSGLNLSLGDIQLPTVEGLVSPGLDRLLKDAVDIGVFMYKGTILQAIPSLFESTVRDLVTGFLEDSSCPELLVDEEDSFIDLRDLLLDTNDAVEAGATGEAPYGDLASSIYGIGQGMWQEVEEDGTLGLNSLLISPITEAFSDEEGLIRIPGNLFNFTTNEENQQEFKELVDRFEFAIYDLRVDNLNTIVHPMALIQPVNHPYVTESTINMGPLENKAINVTIDMRMSLDIEDSPLAMDNIVTMGFSVASVELFVELLTMISTNRFLNYQIGDGTKPSCWFSVLPPPDLNTRGYRVEGGMDRGVELRRFLAKMSDLQLSIDCIQCSPGLLSLPEMVDIFDRSKVTEVLSKRLPVFAEEIAISEAMQVAFDRWLVAAPYSCPHREEYDPDWGRPKSWETPEFTKLSIEASDTIFFSAVVAAGFAAVLLVETHYPWELSTLEPLSGQQNFVAPEGSLMFDWTHLTEGFDDLADDARDYLAQKRVDEETGVEDLGINHLVRDFAIDDRGVLDVIQLLGGEPLEFSVEGVVFLFNSIVVRGLDTFTRFDAFKPIAPQTILNSMHMEYLEIDMNVSTGSRTDPEQYVTMSLKMEDINATVPLFAAIDRNKLKLKELGHFLLGSSIFPCFLSAGADVHFPQILLTIGNISEPTFSGFMDDSQAAVEKAFGEAFDRYGKRALKALPIMFDVTARTFINSFIKDYIGRSNCTHVIERAIEKTPIGEETYAFDGFVDFRELLLRDENSTAAGGRGNMTYGDSIRSLIVPIQEELLSVSTETGLAGNVNSLLAVITSLISGEDGVIVIPGDVFPPIPTFRPDIGALLANLTFSIGGIRIDNIDTLGNPLSLLMPVFMRPHLLENSVGLGLGGRPVIVSVRFSLDMLVFNADTMEIDKNVTNDMIIKLSMDDAVAVFSLLAKAEENKFIHFPMEDIFNPYCWLSLMPASNLNIYGIREEGEVPSVSLTELVVSVSKLNLTVDCIRCDSPGMQGLTDALSQPVAVSAVTDLANDALELMSTIVTGNLVQDEIDRALIDAAHRCPHVESDEPPVYQPLDFSTSVETNSLVYLLAGVILSLMVGIAVVTAVIRWIVNRRHQKWLRTLPVQKVHIIQHLQDADDQLERELNEDTSAMITTKEIPASVRYLMPIIILGNIAMFVSGHMDIAADVAVSIRVAGEDFTLDQFFSFSIIESTIDMWEAGTKEMAIFILVFSGIWPYVKQILSLICWVIPPSWLSISTRGSVYIWLDVLAKWSMVDIFVVLLYMIAFRVEAVTPDVVFLPPDFFGLDFFIVPKWGIYANLIAQMISQISSHFIIYYHRTIVRRATRNYEARHAIKPKGATDRTTANSEEPSDDTGDDRNRLCDGAFSRPHKGESSKLIARQIASYGLVVGTFLFNVFLIVGCSLPCLSVEIQGIMSFISGAGGDGEYKEFNVFDVALLLFKDGIRLGGFKYISGHVLLGSVLILTVFIVPILQAIALAFHWFKPMNDRQRKKFSAIIEILGAWQYAEVFILAMLVSAWQQGTTSEVVMADQCSQFNEIFKMLAYYGIIEREQGHCFRVEATILNGTYFLISSALLLALLNTFVGKASFQYFWDQGCVRKEMAMEDHLTVEEAASPIDEKTYKGIHPPPVLFADTFRWVLRPEHLGDRPLKGIIVEGPGDDHSDHEENISSASAGTWQDQEKSLEEQGNNMVRLLSNEVEC